MKNRYSYKLDFEIDSNQFVFLETGLQKIFDDMYHEEIISYKPVVKIESTNNKMFITIDLEKGYIDY